MKRILVLCFLMLSVHVFSDIDWSTPPATLSTVNVDSSDPRVVVDTSGNATAIWVEAGVIMSSTQPFGGSWGAASTLSGSGASTPRIRVDGSGNITATWVENGVVNSATLPFGGSWSAATALSGSGASAPSLAVDNTGNAVAIWIRNGFVESATKLFGGSWSLVHMLSNVGSEVAPRVAIGSNGQVVAVWGTLTGGTRTVVSATSLIDGNWGAAFNMLSVPPALNHNYPVVAVDANGNAIAIWFKYNVNGSQFSNVQVLAATLASGSSTWLAIPIVLDTNSGSRDPATLSSRVSFDNAGNAIAMWTNSYDGETFNVSTAVKPFGSDWITGGTPVQQNLYAFNSDVAVSGIGDSVATYMFFDGSDILIQAIETDIRSTTPNFFSVPVNLSTGTGNSSPSVSETISGSTIYGASVWVNFNGTNNTIVASTGTKTVLDGPTGLGVVQSSNNFGVFTEYFNTLSWTPSVDPDVIRYNVYRNGIFFTAVDSNITQIEDHNAIQNGAVTYGVSALNSQFDQSAVATVNFP